MLAVFPPVLLCVSCVLLAEWRRSLMLCLPPVNHLCYWRQSSLCLYLSSSACTHILSLIALSYHHSKSYSCNCNPIVLQRAARRAVTGCGSVVLTLTQLSHSHSPLKWVTPTSITIDRLSIRPWGQCVRCGTSCSTIGHFPWYSDSHSSW